MHLPFIQIANEVVDVVAPEVAVALEADELAILGGLMRLYRWAVQRCPDHLPPSACDVIQGPNAAKLIARAAGHTGDPEAYVSACETASMPAMERVGDGIRIRGLDRYDEAWGKQHKRAVGLGEYQTSPDRAADRSEHAKKAAKDRWAVRHAQSNAPSMLPPCSVDAPSDAQNAPQTQTQTQTHKESKERESAAGAAPPSALQDLWNKTADPRLPRWKEMPKQRFRRSQACLKERPLAAWGELIEIINASAFCLGQNDRGWVATPDWLIQPGVAAKVLEGKYTDRSTGLPRPKVNPEDLCSICHESADCFRSGDVLICYGCQNSGREAVS